MKKALVIYNPVAGQKKLLNTKRIIEDTLKKTGYEYDFFETLPVSRQPLEQFAEKKYDRIIVSGGDGTVAEVTSFLIDRKIKTPLVIIPQGSANILAVSLQLPLMPGMALSRGLRSEGRALDAMKINNQRYGMIATGVGYDTMVMADTPRYLKRKIGFFAYLWTVLKTILYYHAHPYKLTIDGRRITVMAKTIMAFNLLPLGHLKITKPFTGIPISPKDGLLNIFSLNPKPVRNMLGFRKMIQVFQGKKISIKTKKARRYQIDGNVFKGRTVTIEVLPKAIYIAY